MHQTFEEALNIAGFPSGRPKQDKVFDAFRLGKHVILKAPTGWGKTFAVNAALGEGHHIYSLPLRVLVDSLVKASNDDFRLFKSVAHHGQERNHPFLDPGDDPDNPIKLVYTTLDQTLSAFLGIPIGVSFRQGNILPAVIDNSHLIFDEFHLFEPERSWTTALFTLQRAKKNCVILTATLSDYMLEFLEEFLATTIIGREYGVEVIEADRPFVNRKELLKGDGFKNIEKIELGRRTIIIKNDITSAKETAQELRKYIESVHLLHSELLSKDRKDTEEKVKSIFSKGSKEQGVLIATQVVEAGIDITCDVMHTDLCPPSSFIQRAGRSARYEGEESKIIWHPVENAGPYRSQANLIEELEQYLEDKQLLDEKTEQEIINLSETFDKEQVAKFKQRNVREVDKLRSQRDYSAYQDMIRTIDNKNVAIGTDLNQSYHFISVARSKFYNKKSFFYKAAREKPSKYGIYNSELREVVLTDHIGKADFILLDPEFVGYQKDFGFTFDRLGGFEKFIDESRDTWVKYDYENETYEEHINRLFQELSTASWMIDYLADHPWIGTRQNANFIARFLIWAHDLGKLTLKWQQAHQVSPGGTPMAHTKEGGKFERIRRPPKHAWISAWIVVDYLLKTFGEEPNDSGLTKSVFWAIADHHGYSGSLNKKDIQPFKIGYLEYLDAITAQNDWIEDKWNSSMLDPIVLKESETEKVFKNIQSFKMLPDDDLDLYFMFCYILRKADQNATKMVSIEKEVEQNRNKQISNFV